MTLVWSAPGDLDLYVTEPNRETAYYAMPRTRSGGAYAGDARCADAERDGGEERVHWTHPPPGRYRVGVDLPEVCRGRAQEVPYRIVVERDGRVDTVAGRAHLAEREPNVMEFIVPARARQESAR